MQTLLSVPENLVNTFNQLVSGDHKNSFIISDPTGLKIGSGGGTAWLLANHYQKSGQRDFNTYLSSKKKNIIHAGGQSRRLPAYAPSGKILTPIPVFRWSRGQSIFQNLLQLQTPLYEEILSATDKNSNTLIASGDVLILPGQHFHSIPEADVICVGIWVAPHLASKHGVFFTPREKPSELSFMLQKPNNKRIEELAGKHLFMMDAGIWILSDKAVNILMKKCGWNGQSFNNQLPEFYDMYSEFGTCLGKSPTYFDPEISSLSSAILPLENGEFYHYGTSLELITSTEAIQNRIKDQRAIWHHRVKPHPSLFVQNTITDFNFTDQHHHIWMENSHIPSAWQLTHHHILTGIPENNWQLSIPENICLDIIPVGTRQFCIRPYGMNDTFTEKASTARWLHLTLKQWLKNKGTDFGTAGITIDEDIQYCPLFPVISIEHLTGPFIQWLTDPERQDEAHTDLWLNSERWSAADISVKANLLRLFSQREEFAWKTIPKLAANYKRSVFYQTDLKELARRYAEKKLPLPEAPSRNESPLTLARDFMFRSETLRNSGINDHSEEHSAHQVLQEAIYQSDTHHSSPSLNVFPDQIVWGRSPARLDLAGGWSDTPPYCLQSGGSVINLAVNLNGQPPLQVFIRLSCDHKITLRSIDNGVSETIETYQELGHYRDVGSAFSIPRAALCLAGFHPDYNPSAAPSLKELLQKFGGGIEISLLVAIPKGSGLGTSSILAATILGALSNFCALKWDKQSVCHKTLILEQMLTTGGGWQDQYGGIFPGVKMLCSQPGLQNHISIDWFPDSLFTASEYRENWLLYYTGITRVAKNILAEIVRGMFLNEETRLRIIDQIKEHAGSTGDAIQKCDYQRTADMIQRSWELNKKLDPGTNTEENQSIIDKIEVHTSGLKLLGAGGGGYLLIAAKDKYAAQKIKEILTNEPPNNRARFVDMSISREGLQVSRS